MPLGPENCSRERAKRKLVIYYLFSKGSLFKPGEAARIYFRAVGYTLFYTTILERYGVQSTKFTLSYKNACLYFYSSVRTSSLPDRPYMFFWTRTYVKSLHDSKDITSEKCEQAQLAATHSTIFVVIIYLLRRASFRAARRRETGTNVLQPNKATKDRFT